MDLPSSAFTVSSCAPGSANLVEYETNVPAITENDGEDEEEEKQNADDGCDEVGCGATQQARLCGKKKHP